MLSTQFGAVYVPATEFEKLPNLGLSKKILNHPDNTIQQQKTEQAEFVRAAKTEFTVKTGITSRNNGIIIITKDDGPAGIEPTKNSAQAHQDQTWVTNYLEGRKANYIEGNFADLKEQSRPGGVLDKLA